MAAEQLVQAARAYLEAELSKPENLESATFWGLMAAFADEHASERERRALERVARWLSIVAKGNRRSRTRRDAYLDAERHVRSLLGPPQEGGPAKPLNQPIRAICEVPSGGVSVVTGPGESIAWPKQDRRLRR